MSQEHYNALRQYEILLMGILPADWSHWFSDFSITYDEDANTILKGIISDQAALHGVLAKVRDLGMTLLEVRRVTDQ